MSNKEDLNLTIWLPADVMVYIFRMLSAAQLAAASCTCKFWYRSSKNPQLSWTVLSRGTLYERVSVLNHGNAEERKADRQKLGPAFSLEIENSSHVIWMVNADLKRITSVSVSAYHIWDSDFKPLLETPSCIDGKLYRLVIHEGFHNFYPTIDHGGIPNKFDVELQLNLRTFENLLREGKEVPNLSWLISYVISHQTCNSLFPPNFKFETVSTPLDKKDSDFDQPNGFTSAVKLHRYQRAAVHWMRTIENDSQKPLKYCRLASWKGVDALFDLDHGKPYSVPDGVKNFATEVKFRGGILADEMGLGKTLEMLGLILENPASEDFLKRKPNDLIPTKATLVLCPNHLATQWLNEIRSHATKLRVLLISIYKEISDLKISDLISADVVMVSFPFLVNTNYNTYGKGLTEQLKRISELKTRIKTCSKDIESLPACLEQMRWHRVILDEAHQAFSDPLRLEIIPRIESQFRWFVSGTPFANEELLISARRFLRSDSHEIKTEDCYYLGCNAKQFALKVEIDLMLRNLYWRNTKASVESDWTIPNLQHETILIDFHPIESLAYELKQTCSLDYSSEYILSVGRVPHFVEKLCGGGIPLCSAYGLPNDYRSWLQNQLDHYIGINKTSVESALEALRNKERQLEKYCSVKDAKEKDQNELAWLRSDLENKEKTLFTYEKLLARLNTIPSYSPPASLLAKPVVGDSSDAEELVDEDDGDFESDKKKKTKKKKPVKRPGKRKATGNDEDDAAPKKKGNAGKRKKKEAVEEDLADPKKKRGREASPVKNTVMKDRGGKAEKAEEEKEEFKLEHLVQRYGSKPAHVLSWMRKLFSSNQDARVIIFSQDDQQLSFVEELLESNNIPSCYVVGNVFRKNKALRMFKNDESACRVILLSTSRAAAGLNLMEASHIILLDSMTGSREYAKAQEAQAIARAYRQGQKNHVTVVRFVITNTIDYEFYVRNTSPEKGIEIEMIPVVLRGERSQMVRTTSISALLANSKSAVLLEDSTKKKEAEKSAEELPTKRSNSITKLLISNPNLE